MQSPVYFKLNFIRIDFYRNEKEPFSAKKTFPCLNGCYLLFVLILQRGTAVRLYRKLPKEKKELLFPECRILIPTIDHN